MANRNLQSIIVFLVSALFGSQPASRAAEPMNLVGPYEAVHAFQALSPHAQMVEEIQESTRGEGFRLNPPMSPDDEAKPYCQSKISATAGQIDDFIARFRESPILKDGLNDPSLKESIKNVMRTRQVGKRIELPIVHASLDSLPVLTYPDSMKRPTAEQHVKLAVAVSKEGRVSALLVTCSDDQEAIDVAVRGMQSLQFKPAMFNGKPVTDVVVLPITFKS